MRAMSLIHQRLYQSEKDSSIDMQQYIRELMEYLDENFNLGHRICFDLQLEKIDMDVAQAVPVGLILNEAITNAIKYAFPDNRVGAITLSMSHTADSNLLLVVSDNGRGLPVDFDITKIKSLGMSLMQGLTRQLNGTFRITNNDGLQITIQFPDEKMTKYSALTA
jgi:two-component sensor histidine kinase